MLSRLLVYLDSPTVITKTLALMQQDQAEIEDDLGDLLSRNRGYGTSNFLDILVIRVALGGPLQQLVEQ